MAIVDNKTPNLEIPLPDTTNDVSDDIARLITALNLIDQLVSLQKTTLNDLVQTGLAGLANVEFSNLADGDILRLSGSKWTNGKVQASAVSNGAETVEQALAGLATATGLNAANISTVAGEAGSNAAAILGINNLLSTLGALAYKSQVGSGDFNREETRADLELAVKTRTENGYPEYFDGEEWIKFSVGGVVGSILPFASPNVPEGFLECDGSLIGKEAYEDLYAVIGDTWGGDELNFALPDLRGEFLRGWDNGRGVDAARVFGSNQLDAMQNVTGWFASGLYYNTLQTSGVFSDNDVNYGYDTRGGYGNGGRVQFALSNQARTADQTRPRNVALLFAVKY